MDLRGAGVLLTGPRRLGAHLAERLADRGARLALTSHRSGPQIEALAERLRARGVFVITISADLSQADQAIRTVQEAHESLGRLDILINMASVYQRTPFDQLSPNDFDAMIGPNLAAPYHCSVEAGRIMLQQPPRGPHRVRGKILTLGDWATDRPERDYLPYLVAKGGLATMTLALAKELAPGVPVNLIQPGTVLPPEDLEPDRLAAIHDQTPLERTGDPDDVTNLVLYLLEGTDFVTGARFVVDGGRVLGP